MRLAPLEPDAFLRWAYRYQGGIAGRGFGPLTVEDIAFELGRPVESVRRDYLHLAALVRRNQRAGVEPFSETSRCVFVH